MRPVDELLELVKRPRISGEDDVVAKVEIVQLRHAFLSGQQDGRMRQSIPGDAGQHSPRSIVDLGGRVWGSPKLQEGY